MAVSKKIRFEVFKRDGFQCAYCGKSPPSILLELDHIKPRSKKGKDDINNLITSCFDCNRGKGNISLNIAPQQLVDNLQVLKQKEEQLAEYQKFVRKIERRIDKQIAEIEIIFQEFYPNRSFTDIFKRGTLKRFLDRLPNTETKDAMYLACSRITQEPDRTIKYFCGICWNKIRAKECQKETL